MTICIFAWLRRLADADISHSARSFAVQLVPLVDNSTLSTPMTVRKVSQRLGHSVRSVKRWRTELLEEGLLAPARGAVVFTLGRLHTVVQQTTKRPKVPIQSPTRCQSSHLLTQPKVPIQSPSHSTQGANPVTYKVPIQSPPPTPPYNVSAFSSASEETREESTHPSDVATPSASQVGKGEVVDEQPTSNPPPKRCEAPEAVQAAPKPQDHSTPTNQPTDGDPDEDPREFHSRDLPPEHTLNLFRRPRLAEPLEKGEMLRLWEDKTGASFMAWRQTQSWRADAPTWLAILRWTMRRPEWLSVCTAAADKKRGDRVNLKYLTIVANKVLKANRVQVQEPDPVESTDEELAHSARVTNLVYIATCSPNDDEHQAAVQWLTHFGETVPERIQGLESLVGDLTVLGVMGQRLPVQEVAA